VVIFTVFRVEYLLLCVLFIGSRCLEYCSGDVFIITAGMGPLLTISWPLYHEILRQILDSKPHYRAHKNQKLDSVVNQNKPDHILIFYVTKSTCSRIWCFRLGKYSSTFRRSFLIAVGIPSSPRRRRHPSPTKRL
jgi:hypothetical protein